MVLSEATTEWPSTPTEQQLKGPGKHADTQWGHSEAAQMHISNEATHEPGHIEILQCEGLQHPTEAQAVATS